MRKVVMKVPDEVLQADLERYRRQAIELGATAAEIISSDQIIIDDRVLMKCVYPKCSRYGTSANCPPHAVKPQEMQEIVKKFRYAIFWTTQSPPQAYFGPDATRQLDLRRKLEEITSRLEATAFYDGYYLALGFGGGSCKALYCPDVECSALELGKGCRAALKARSSMEAVGMDAYLMATRAGWDIYPCGRSTKVDDVPFVRRTGLVLIY